MGVYYSPGLEVGDPFVRLLASLFEGRALFFIFQRQLFIIFLEGGVGKFFSTCIIYLMNY